MSHEDTLTLSSVAVRCVCITASFVVLACALLGLGIACIAIAASSSQAGPCPNNLVVSVFSCSGGLLLVSITLSVHLFSNRKKLTKKDGDQVFAVTSTRDSLLRKEQQVDDVIQNDIDSRRERVECDDLDNFEMIQKSADVSYWIEHQEATEAECFPLEIQDGDTKHASHRDSGSYREVTTL